MDSATPDIDEAYLPVHRHIRDLMPVAGCIIADAASGTVTYAEEIRAEMPVELWISVGAGGRVAIGSAPPLYYADTSLQPVFHQLRVRIGIEAEE